MLVRRTHVDDEPAAPHLDSGGVLDEGPNLVVPYAKGGIVVGRTGGAKDLSRPGVFELRGLEVVHRISAPEERDKEAQLPPHVPNLAEPASYVSAPKISTVE